MLHRQRDCPRSSERDRRGGSLPTATSTTPSGPIITFRGVAAIRSAAAAAGALAALMTVSTCVPAVDGVGTGEHPLSLSKVAMKQNAGATVAGTASVTQVAVEEAACCISRHNPTYSDIGGLSWSRVCCISHREEGMREGLQVWQRHHLPRRNVIPAFAPPRLAIRKFLEFSPSTTYSSCTTTSNSRPQAGHRLSPYRLLSRKRRLYWNSHAAGGYFFSRGGFDTEDLAEHRGGAGEGLVRERAQRLSVTTLRAEMAGKDPGNREVMSTGTIALAASAAAVVSAEEVPPTTPIGNENISSSTVGASSAKDGRKGGSIDVCAGRRVSSGGRGSGTVKEGVRSGGVMAGVLRPLLDALDGARGHAATGAAAMKVLETVERAGWDGITFSPLRLGKVAAGAAVAGKWRAHGRPLLERMEIVGVSSGDIRSWTAVLLPLSRLACADACLEVLGMMESAIGANQGVFGDNRRLKCHGRRDGSTATEGFVDDREALLTVAHNHCMYAFVKAGRYEEAVAYFDRYFRRSQASEDEIFLRTGDDSGSSHGDGVQSSPVGRWRESVLPPDIFSYTHLMSSLEKLGRERACLSAIHDMRARGIKADTYCYVSGMKALGAAGQWETAVSLLSELRDIERVAPDVYVYTAAISACSTAGRWEEAFILKGEMVHRGIKPNGYTVTSCISALARAGEWERALQELKVAEEDGLPVSTPAFNAAMKAFAIAKALEPGLEFFRDMQRDGRVPLDEQTYNIAIELCKECGETSKALAILRSMATAGFPPSVVSFNTVLGACEATGDYRLSLELFREMRLQGGRIAPDILSYNAALGTCARAGQWDAVATLLGEMDKTQGGNGSHSLSRRSRNFITFATLIMAADAVGEPRRCLEFYAEMGRWGLSPNVPVYEAVARACLASRSWRWAILVHKDAASKHSASESTAAAAAIAAMAASGADFSPDTILPLLQLPVDSDGFPEYKEAGGVGGDDGLVKFESLTAAAGCAMRAMAKAGDWAAISALFDAFLEVAEPSVHLRVMYIRAEAALARSESESESESDSITEYSAAQGIFTDQRENVFTTVGKEQGDDGEKGVRMKENCSDGPKLMSKMLPGDVPPTSPGVVSPEDGPIMSLGDGPLISPGDGPLMSPGDGGGPITFPPTRAISTRPDMAALRALKRLEDLGLNPGEAEHAAALIAAAEAGRFTSSIAVLRSLRGRGLKCNQRAGAAALSSLARHKDWSGTAAVAEELELFGPFNHTSYSATAAIAAYGHIGKWENAVNLIENLMDAEDRTAAPVASTAVFNAGIMACSKAKRIEEGLQLLRDMWKRDVPRDVQTYNTAIALCKSVGEWTRAVGMLDAMEYEGIAPNAVTFNTVIAACEAGADHWTAFSLFNQMERSGLTPDVWTYNSLANVLGSCGDWERALGLLEDMRDRGLTPDVVTYTALISACEKAGQVDASLKVLEEMSRDGVEANERTLSAAIKAVSSWREGLSDSSDSRSLMEEKLLQVSRLHQQAKEKGVANVVTYSAAIRACARHKGWREALGLLSEMRRDGIDPNDYSFNAAMWACINAGEGKLALQLFDCIKDAPADKGMVPMQSPSKNRHAHVVDESPGSSFRDEDDYSRGRGRSPECYMAAITACQKEKDFPRALLLVQHMREKGVKGSLGLYNLVLSMCQRYGDADTSKRLLGMMRLDRVSPSVVSCNQVISSCEKAGRWQDAISILRAMISGGVKPNLQTVCSALRACCLGDSPGRALRLLHELGEVMGTALSLPAYNTLVVSFHRDGRYDLADFFYKQAYKEEIVGHWQLRQQQQQQQGHHQLSESGPARHADLETVGGAIKSPSPERNLGAGGVEIGVMDLHGFSLPLAHAAVRCALEEIWRVSQKEHVSIGDLVIITGVGKGSLHAYHPVVRPEVQRMLMEEFYPPIDSATEVGNPGRVVIKACAIKAWLDHNMEAKRPVMAKLASVLERKARPVAMARLAAALRLKVEAEAESRRSTQKRTAAAAEQTDEPLVGHKKTLARAPEDDFDAGWETSKNLLPSNLAALQGKHASRAAATATEEILDNIGGRVGIYRRELAGDTLLLSASPRRTGEPIKKSAPRVGQCGPASSASRVVLAPDAAAVLTPRGVLRHRRRYNS